MEQEEKSAITEGYANTQTGFTPRATAAALDANFLNNDYCRIWILHRLHPSGPHCPVCNLPVTDDTTISNFWAGKRCTCNRCGKWFTATTGTFLQGTQLSFSQLFLLASFADFLATGLTIPRVAAALNISPETVRIWIQRFKVLDGGESRR